MDTEPGGEQSQYETYKGLNDPPSKQSGQLGGNLPNTTTESKGVDADRAQQTTDNIRYGQNISESGMGGMTTDSTGSAKQEGGYGGTEAQKELEQGDKNPRTSQQYTPKDGTHDYRIGA